MTRGQTGRFLLWASLLLVSLFILVAWWSPAPNVTLKDAATVLAIITAAAVGIERLLEGFWTAIGLTRGSWWPLNLVSEQVDGFLNSLNSTLTPFYDELTGQLKEAEAAHKITESQLEAALLDIQSVRNDIDVRIGQLKELAPDNQRVAMITASAKDGVNYLSKKYEGVTTDLTHATDLAGEAITAASSFAGTFKDNPGRRLISLYFGACIGLIVAGWLGLDLFQAAGLAVTDPAAVGGATTPIAPSAPGVAPAGAATVTTVPAGRTGESP